MTHTFSPTNPKKDIKDDFAMTFPEAIKKVIEGKKIYSKDWGSIEFYGALIEGRLKLHKPDGKFYDWILSDGDLMATDWFVL